MARGQKRGSFGSVLRDVHQQRVGSSERLLLNGLCWRRRISLAAETWPPETELRGQSRRELEVEKERERTREARTVP